MLKMLKMLKVLKVLKVLKKVKKTREKINARKISASMLLRKKQMKMSPIIAYSYEVTDQ